MIVIHQPVIKEDIQFVNISSKINVNGKERVLWYKLSGKFQKYLVVEQADAFLVGILFLALKKGYDIKINAAISHKLYYNISHYLINALCLANPQFKKIKIYATQLSDVDLNIGNIAGTGLSCGVDSFATYYDHLDEIEPFKIEYFTFFNSGSHGDLGGEHAWKVYNDRLHQVSSFAHKVEKDVITVDSNISEILQMNFLQTNSLRNISCILHLQKLFKNYYLASKNRFDIFNLNAKDNQDYDTLILGLLSTESLTFHSAVSQLKRTERTNFISTFPDTYSHLDVCTNPNERNNKINCSKCDKCLRTQLTLDLYDKLELYHDVFHLEEFYKRKNQFIGKILNFPNDPFNIDIYEVLKEKKLYNRIYWSYKIKYKMRSKTLGIKKLLKKKL
ncbi:hypothetical protein OQ279_04965 [Salinimicrobium sp. MT39]|uniref:Uncharacterized protein n=1 Tax=Salinimicrobium profundisediminis TaxID=2994553 RepID=A0A9X3CVJ1_9FLAO|nr:hypothetical protein [Salinimicrobium profundisediminis]MCX2837496.1 hypothetical protein [Salinimicrobium profundisediminis]